MHEEGEFVAELAFVDGEIALAVLVGLKAVDLELHICEILAIDYI